MLLGVRGEVLLVVVVVVVVAEVGEDVVLGLMEVDVEVDVLEGEVGVVLLPRESTMVNKATLPASESVLDGAGEESLLASV
jgi:hypothetical protein